MWTAPIPIKKRVPLGPPETPLTRRLYEQHGFVHTGREKEADFGGTIVHYARRISEG